MSPSGAADGIAEGAGLGPRPYPAKATLANAKIEASLEYMVDSSSLLE